MNFDQEEKSPKRNLNLLFSERRALNSSNNESFLLQSSDDDDALKRVFKLPLKQELSVNIKPLLPSLRILNSQLMPPTTVSPKPLYKM